MMLSKGLKRKREEEEEEEKEALAVDAWWLDSGHPSGTGVRTWSDSITATQISGKTMPSALD